MTRLDATATLKLYVKHSPSSTSIDSVSEIVEEEEEDKIQVVETSVDTVKGN